MQHKSRTAKEVSVSDVLSVIPYKNVKSSQVNFHLNSHRITINTN